jgi:'Cold-shock' DNA-binding domain
MTFNLRTLIGGEKATEVEKVTEDKQNSERIKGRITRVDSSGYCFVSSKEREFTRIFFHWTNLVQDTLHFKELKKGMWVDFIPLEKEGRGINAIKVRVIDPPNKDE